MEYVPYDALGDRPNIVVDGAANAHTLLTLSHWPGNATPVSLKDDLSAQIVFHYLDHPEMHVSVEAVSNNHFDQDGLVGVYGMVKPSEAQQQRAFLIDVAAAGDFGTYRFRDAARVNFVLSAFADPEASPLDSRIFQASYPRKAAQLYQHLLPLLPEMVKDLDKFREYWEAEDAMLANSEGMIRDGKVQIEEFPDLDLAIVTIPESLSGRKVHRFTRNQNAACHPMALNNVSNALRVLQVQGRTYELQYRYETWVEYISRKTLPRIDLSPLAEELSKLEAGTGRWTFDGVDELTPKLALTGAEESRIPPHEFVERIKHFLSIGK